MTYDNINPDHYKGDRQFEPIEVIEDWNLNYNLGNALKYISRSGRKPGENVEEGLCKAVWYLEREIDKIRDTKASKELAYEEITEFLRNQVPTPDFPAGLDDIVFYGDEVGATYNLDFSRVYEGSEEDLADFWESEDVTGGWDPSVGPVEVNYADRLEGKDLSQFDEDEIVTIFERRGIIIGVRKDGSSCELGRDGRCIN